MKFEELYNMYVEMYEKPNRMRASDGNTWFRGKPAGFMGDDGRAGVNGVLPQGMFPQAKPKSSRKNKYKK